MVGLADHAEPPGERERGGDPEEPRVPRVRCPLGPGRDGAGDRGVGGLSPRPAGCGGCDVVADLVAVTGLLDCAVRVELLIYLGDRERPPAGDRQQLGRYRLGLVIRGTGYP